MVEDLAPVLPARIGRHDVLAYIATGGMAELFLGKDPTTQRPVVIKRILPHLARQTGFVSMFIDEARLGSMIRHPNLVEHLELGQVGTELFMVMEYLEGENLSGMIRRLFRRRERLDYGLAAYIAAQACLGLHAAHLFTDDYDKPLQIVHRDVSPSNIFVTYEGEVKVLDFGIATTAHRLTQQTATGEIKGKFSYMSPEQCRGEVLDARSDIFSLGIVLYELSTLKRLFKRDNELLMLSAVCEDPIPRPSNELPDYPKQLEDICLRALSRDRERRYPSANAMHVDLVNAMTAIGAGSNPRGSLNYEMLRLFAHRIAEKKELVNLVRTGSALGALPASEVDENVEVPDVTRAASATPSNLRARSDAPARANRRFDRRWIALPLLVAIGFVGAWYVDRDHESAQAPKVVHMKQAAVTPSGPPTPAVSPPPPPPPPAVSPPPSAVAPPAAPSVEVFVESRPPGTVVVDGKSVGISPIAIRIQGERARIEVRRAGYVPVTHNLALDRDQRLLVTLTRQKRTTPVAKPKPSRDDFQRFDEAR